MDETKKSINVHCYSVLIDIQLSEHKEWYTNTIKIT